MFSRGRSCRGKGSALPQAVCWSKRAEPLLPSCALSSRCHLCCRASSACKPCPSHSNGSSMPPSSAEVHLVTSEALLKPAGSTSFSNASSLLEDLHPDSVLPCLHLLMRYPLLHRCLCSNQTGTVPWSCPYPIPDGCVDREVIRKKIL